MLPVYYGFIYVNVTLALLVGLFIVYPPFKNSSNFKIHLLIVLASVLEIGCLFCSQSASPILQAFLFSLMTQLIWSCILLHNAFQQTKQCQTISELQNELKKHQGLYDEIKSLALSDALTNIANRRNFDMFLKTELHRASSLQRPVSLIIMDLDKFKIYNDTFGHLSGDKLLAQIGQILRHHTRPIDLPARYGGEEFSIILPNVGIDEAAIIAENLRQVIEKSNFPDHSGSFNAKITASFGVATYDPQLLPKQPDVEKIISIADKALYKAKQEGRNRVSVSVIFQ